MRDKHEGFRCSADGCDSRVNYIQGYILDSKGGAHVTHWQCAKCYRQYSDSTEILKLYQGAQHVKLSDPCE